MLFCFWGVLTTLVNLAVYFLCRKIRIPLTVSTVLAWFFAVLFAFITNRKYVFNSRARSREALLECAKFYGSRIFSGIMEVVFMLLFAKVLHADDFMNKYISITFLSEFWSKFFTEIIVSLLNYVLSIFFVFH